MASPPLRTKKRTRFQDGAHQGSKRFKMLFRRTGRKHSPSNTNQLGRHDLNFGRGRADRTKKNSMKIKKSNENGPGLGSTVRTPPSALLSVPFVSLCLSLSLRPSPISVCAPRPSKIEKRYKKECAFLTNCSQAATKLRSGKFAEAPPRASSPKTCRRGPPGASQNLPRRRLPGGRAKDQPKKSQLKEI